MPTIKQLPVATSVNATDVLPVSQGGTTKGLSIAGLLSSTQPALSLASGKLLGRASLSAGGPEPLGLGPGLSIEGGALAATGDDHLGLPVAAALGDGDEVVVNSSGVAKRMSATGLRDLFRAGPGVSIAGGVISSSISYALPAASQVTLGGVRVDGSSIVVDQSGVISVGSANILFPALFGASASSTPIVSEGASFTLQNGNVTKTDLPSAPEAYDGLRSVLALQPGSSVTQASAVGGYVLNRSVFDTAINKNAGVALWGESVADVDGAKSWGMALHVHDGTSPGDGSGRLVINEIDVGVNHANTVAVGLAMSAGFGVQPNNADGYVAASFSSTTRWVNGFRTFPGGATTALRIGQNAGAGPVGSQPIVFESQGSDGLGHLLRVEADPNATLVVTGAGFVSRDPSGAAMLTVFPGGATLSPAVSTGETGSIPLLLLGRDSTGAVQTARVEADQAGGAVVTAGGLTVRTASGATAFRVAAGGAFVGASGNPVAHSGNLGQGLGYDATTGVFRSTAAPVVSPAFTGVPTAPTAAQGVSSGQLATTAFVQGATAACLPATTTLLAGSGAAGSVQPATNAQLTTALASWFLSLPTSLPTAPGQPWNNGNILSFS